MAQFYTRINKRIESLNSWKDTISRIDKLNDLILVALKERSKFPVCRDYFENTPQKELESKGIDTIWWSPFYSKIVEKVCSEGDYVEGVVEAESKLEELIRERVHIGNKVAEYKSQRGGVMLRKGREAQIIAYVRDYASKNEMDPEAIEEVFRMLIEKNKHIQKLYNSSRNGSNGFKKIDMCITMVSNDDHKKMKEDSSYIPDSIMSIRKRFESEAARLQGETGELYHVLHKHKSDKGSILPIYAITLVKE